MWKVEFTYRGAARSKRFDFWWQAEKFIKGMAREGVSCKVKQGGVR